PCLRIRLAAAVCSFSLQGAPAPELHTLSLHDALPIWGAIMSRLASPIRSAVGMNALDAKLRTAWRVVAVGRGVADCFPAGAIGQDRKSTRLNSSHLVISYAVFCLKTKTPYLYPTRLFR